MRLWITLGDVCFSLISCLCFFSLNWCSRFICTRFIFHSWDHIGSFIFVNILIRTSWLRNNTGSGKPECQVLLLGFIVSNTLSFNILLSSHQGKELISLSFSCSKVHFHYCKDFHVSKSMDFDVVQPPLPLHFTSAPIGTLS